MVRAIYVLTAFWLTASFPAVVAAQGLAPSIVGVWKITAVETRELVSGKVVRPFGDQPSGTFIFTPGGQMIGNVYATNRNAPASANPTDVERAALHSSMSAYSGHYRVGGKKVFIAIEGSSIQSWNGTTRVINVDLDGKKLTGTSEPLKASFLVMM